MKTKNMYKFEYKNVNILLTKHKTKKEVCTTHFCYNNFSRLAVWTYIEDENFLIFIDFALVTWL